MLFRGLIANSYENFTGSVVCTWREASYFWQQMRKDLKGMIDNHYSILQRYVKEDRALITKRAAS